MRGVHLIPSHQFGRTPPANWKRRTEIIQYCVDVVDHSINLKRSSIENDDLSNETKKDLRQASFEEEVKVSFISVYYLAYSDTCYPI